MGHTAESAEELTAAQRQVQRAAAEHGLRLSIIVPVFNNGEHLRTRAFPSLAASPHFAHTHVLLIDDGSTYQSTLDAVAELAAGHPNVDAFFRPAGGSGSASSARNTGLALCSTDYVGYLDPDDELLEGHWGLVEGLERHHDAELAIGNQVRVFSHETQTVDNLGHYLHAPVRAGVGEAGPEVLVEAKFRSTNLSSWVARTRWLKSTGLEQVPGAAGQDSLFFLQVFAAASRFAAVDRLTYRYHTEVPGSMVNAITTDYFRKALLREEAQRVWLEKAGLLSSFLQVRFEHFFVTWYLEKFARLPWAQREESAALLHRIAELYVGDPAAHRWRFPQSMQFFGRWSIPSVQGLRPWAGSIRRGAQKSAKGAAGQAARAAARLRQDVRTRRGLDR